MSNAEPIDVQLAALRSHLSARTSEILAAWHCAVQADSELTTAAALPRKQFYDHIPQLLDAFAQKLSRNPMVTPQDHQREDAATHGLLRWQQGYHLREVTKEWGRLQSCLADELEVWASSHSALDPMVMTIAWRALGELCADGVRESTAQYFELQQAEAAGHVKDLEHALDELREVEREQGELWRHATHDLRGNLAVVASATSGLRRGDIPEPLKNTFLDLLAKNLGSLHSLLDDMADLTRLRAGQEQAHIAPFNAGVLLVELCKSLEGLALERGLFLRTEGPDSLSVEGDAVKIRRIAQNLLLNALKYTHQGGVTVSWGDSRSDDPERWMLCVTDTGPGFHAGPGAPVAAAIEEATEESRQVQRMEYTEDAAPTIPSSPPPRPPDSRPIYQQKGEGIGLSIVKRLCELLDASLELESTPAVGTVCRVLFPRKSTGA